MRIAKEKETFIKHYGILRRSGRYPYGSGGNEGDPYPWTGSTNENIRHRSFLDHVAVLRKKGLTPTEIARGYGITTTELRAATSIAKNSTRQADINQAVKLKDKGMSNVEIGKRMGGRNESSVRALLTQSEKDTTKSLETIAGMLKGEVAKKKYIDIGGGVENHIGVSKDKLGTAVAILKEEGFVVHSVQVDQLGTGGNQKTTVKVLAPKGTTYVDVAKNTGDIQQISLVSNDFGRTFSDTHEPLSVSSSRIAVRYADQGGKEADGVLYIRPNVADLSMGGKRYAQVRVKVDGTHYIKGMAIYKEGLPAGVDIMFNTNKDSTGNNLDALKPLKDDAEYPFGSVVRQITKKTAGGNEVVTSALNIVNDEGQWDKWSKNLSSQFLSKQSPALAKTQLDMTYESRKNQLDELTGLTNPAVRKKLLDSFADDVDAASIHLKAAKLPRQSTRVILPMTTVKENEVYAPWFRDGEKVVLIRYPHGGTFEIPELTVNNRNAEGKKVIGSDAVDAIGIHHKVAERLSGADFDGDTVLVIPNNERPDGLKVTHTPALEGLKNFDPQKAYPKYEGMPKMKEKTKQVEMGKISNLITDMTIKGASTTELAQAVRHSMVVIDAEKHDLDYKKSAIDNGISKLKERYQDSARGGASTVISNSGKTSTERIPEQKPRRDSQGGPVDRVTGKKVFVQTGREYTDAKGNVVKNTSEVPRLSTVEDAHKYNSGTRMEDLYADQSNRLRALADTARREAVNIKPTRASTSAKAAHSAEVASLNTKLDIALKNRPLERQAQIIAGSIISARKKSNPNMEKADIKKVEYKELEKARIRTEAQKHRIKITDNEWEAIQAGAISPTKLSQILDNADIDRVKELATPRKNLVMTSTKMARAKAMIAAGYSPSDVADALGVAASTLNSALNR